MLIALLASCTPSLTVASFEERYARLACRRLEECARGYYEAQWHAHLDECMEDSQDEFDQMRDYYDHCAFDADKAARCLEQLGSLSCGDLYEDGAEACWEVYNCSGSAWDSGW